MRKLRIALVAAAVLLALAQLVPVERTNPPVRAEVRAPPAVMAALRKSCWDCHSNETVWGWHTRIAPISWLVARDVAEGREHLNFSEWDALDARRLGKLARELPEEVLEGEMPMPVYLLAHPEARPTEAERAAIVGWGRTLGGGAAPPEGARDEGGEAHGRRDHEERGEHRR